MHRPMVGALRGKAARRKVRLADRAVAGSQPRALPPLACEPRILPPLERGGLGAVGGGGGEELGRGDAQSRGARLVRGSGEV